LIRITSDNDKNQSKSIVYSDKDTDIKTLNLPSEYPEPKDTTRLVQESYLNRRKRIEE